MMQWTTTLECKKCHFKAIENHQGWGDCDPEYHKYISEEDCPVCKRVKEALDAAKNTEQQVQADSSTPHSLT
jgi:hypothetical protein